MSNATDRLVALMAHVPHRLLKLYFPNDDGPQAGLLVNHLLAEESVSADFTFTVTALSDDPEIELSEVQGRMICVELLIPNQASRYFNGYCFELSLLSVDNGLAIYQLILKPWLAIFRLRRNHFIFHKQSITEQTKQIFLETGMSRHEFRLQQLDPVRTFSCQYNETDYNYLVRRWEEMGWCYWYEHHPDGHVLILSDSSPSAAAIDGFPSISYHHNGGSNTEEKISAWSPQRRMVSGKLSLSSFDFKHPTPQHVTESGHVQQGNLHAPEVYQYQGLYGFNEASHGKQVAQRRIEQIAAPSLIFKGKSDRRQLQAGRWFRLHKNSYALSAKTPNSESDYFILHVKHEVDNNFLNQDGTGARYENSFTCMPRRTPFRPEENLHTEQVIMPSCDTATVVGPNGRDIYTDDFGRIKIQFHWDRKGGNDENSSAWVRVGSNWAGAELGGIALPRIGSEVLVEWLSGSPDRPIVTGSLFNARHMTPWKLPAQQALTGLRSRELKPAAGNRGSGRSNHLIFDDTYEKIQVQLKSDHHSSQLSLGYITRIESNQGRQEARGEGWELASNAWGVARAAAGMLITTQARHNAQSSAKDMDETTQRLSDAQEQHAELAEQAQDCGVQEKSGQQGEIAQVIRAQNTAIKGTGGMFPELSAPHLVLASPAGIETTTAQSTHIASAQHTAITTGRSFSIASGDSFFASIAKTFRLFVHKAGMKMVAAAGDIDMQALSANIHLLAKLNIKQSAKRIIISAEEEIVINGGGSYAKYSAAGIETGTNGQHIAHAAHHSLIDAKSMKKIEVSGLMRKLRVIGTYDEAFILKNKDTGAILVGKHYRIKRQNGKYEEGRTDENGQTHLVTTRGSEKIEIEIEILD